MTDNVRAILKKINTNDLVIKSQLLALADDQENAKKYLEESFNERILFLISNRRIDSSNFLGAYNKEAKKYHDIAKQLELSGFRIEDKKHVFKNMLNDFDWDDFTR
ncbi:hypothetical protein DCPSUM001_33340 [Dysgonomonas capnocytophagoides]|nr:hypothetical protein DCPSUM001_33340 [Dysgonomonas capnocytophagoides]